jgi:chemotaxis protein MotA
LTLLFTIFKLARGKGLLALESHLDDPYQSELFRAFPYFIANHHVVNSSVKSSR